MYLIKTTSNDKKILQKIAKKLVKNKLSKCVQISKIKSIYMWDEKIIKDKEYCLSIKAAKIKKVYKKIKKYHNYECFEFIYFPIECSAEYKEFLKEN